MRRKVFYLTFSMALISSSASAAENGWGNLGGILQGACSATQGNVGGMSINTGQFGEKMQWLCQLNNIYGFINQNVLNGDWETFAKEVGGKYIGQLVNHIGGGMGNMSGLNNLTRSLNEAMHKDYATFRKALYGTALQTFDAGPSLNAGATPGSVGYLADQAIKSNPILSLADGVARVSDSLEAAQGVENAYKAAKIQSEANKALEANTAQAMNSATNVIGTPLKQGIVDKYSADADTAISSREATQVLVKLTGESMKQSATMSVALLNQLGELAQQQVMTNTQLMMQQKNAEKDILSKQARLRAQIEQEVAENAAEANQYSSEIGSAYDGLHSILSSDIKITPAGQ